MMLFAQMVSGELRRLDSSCATNRAFLKGCALTVPSATLALEHAVMQTKQHAQWDIMELIHRVDGRHVTKLATIPSIIVLKTPRATRPMASVMAATTANAQMGSGAGMKVPSHSRVTKRALRTKIVPMLRDVMVRPENVPRTLQLDSKDASRDGLDGIQI
jgi:hypothetical protein